ncbi:sugar transferase, partial [Mesorhizobium sp.]|uniref:sugar transferase n=1 Tax=Mesorhizobium sp. TaxID=1871066 RepID=UPI0025C69EC7
MTAKRAFDLIIAAVMLALTSPIVLVAMLAIRATSPGPAVFSQPRVGRDGAVFACRKLRTMHRDTPA